MEIVKKIVKKEKPELILFRNGFDIISGWSKNPQTIDLIQRIFGKKSRSPYVGRRPSQDCSCSPGGKGKTGE